MEREESEDAFVWMGASGRRKHTIHILAVDLPNDRRCGLRSSEVQLCTIFDIGCLRQPIPKISFLCRLLKTADTKMITYF
jgi:hypothetical protein